MENGVSLTGEEPPSPLYLKRYKPAALTPQQLDHQAIWRRRAMMQKHATDDEIAQIGNLEIESQSGS